MDWINVILWVFALIHLLTAGYYDLLKDDDVKTTKHAVVAIAMIVLYTGGQV